MDTSLNIHHLAKPSFEEPDAGILHVRICGGYGVKPMATLSRAEYRKVRSTENYDGMTWFNNLNADKISEVCSAAR